MKGYVIFLTIIVICIFSGCKKDDYSLEGSWDGTLVIEMNHDHEEYQTWEERIVNSEGQIEIIDHREHIQWSVRDRITVNFNYNVSSPVYNAQIDGNGTASQGVEFSSPDQCTVLNQSGGQFDVSLFGILGSTSIELEFAPKTLPELSIDLRCSEHVNVIVPDYSSYIAEIFSRLNVRIPLGDAAFYGGSGTVNVSGSSSPAAFIYTVNINRK